MGESAEELYARALGAADGEGRLPLPPLDEWETFPFEGDIRRAAAPAARPTSRHASVRIRPTAGDACRARRTRSGATSAGS